jgi:hypothetical protein
MERAQPLFSDKLLQHHPEVLHTVQEVHAGRIPAWNPHVLGGLPHLATGLPAGFYPPLWLSFGVDPPICYAWVAALQTALAAFFAYGMLQAFGLSCFSSATGALLFAGSGWMSVHQEYFQLTAPATWLPLALWGTWSYLQTGRGLGRLALAVTCSFLSGFPQIACYNLLAVGLLVLVALLCRRCPGASPRRAVPLLALTLLMGLVMAAPQLLPTAELVGGGHSSREPLDAATLQSHALPPSALVGIGLPRILGHPQMPQELQGPVKQSLFGVLYADTLNPENTTNYFERSFFLGAAPLLLMLLGLAAGSWALRAFLVILGAVATALCLPGWPLAATATLPGLNIGDPKRCLFLLSFAVAVLAALGVDNLQRAAPHRRVILLTLATIGAGLGALPWGLSLRLDSDQLQEYLVPRLAEQQGIAAAEVKAIVPAADFEFHLSLLREELGIFGLCGVVTLVLLWWLPWKRLQGGRSGRTVTPMTAPSAGLRGQFLWLALAVPLGWTWWQSSAPQPSSEMNTRPPLIQVLQENSAGGRLLRLGTASGATPVLPPKLPMLYGIDDAQGYVAVYLQRWRDLFECVEPGCTRSVGIFPLQNVELLELPLWDALGVEFVLLDEATDQDPLAPPPGWQELACEGPPRLRVLRNVERPGRAWIVPTVRCFHREEDLLSRLTSEDFDPEGEALMFAIDAADLGVEVDAEDRRVEQLAPSSATSSCELTAATSDSLHFQVQSAGGLLVQNDSYYPGWRAFVDGEEHPLLRVNHALRGVLLPPGSHEVVFRYRPRILYVGLGLFPIGLLGLWILQGLARRTQTRTP